MTFKYDDGTLRLPTGAIWDPGSEKLTLASYLGKLREASGRLHDVDVSGKRWMKIYRPEGQSRSVVAFVDALSGRVHKADSWKKAGRPTGLVLDMGLPSLPPGTSKG